MRRAVVVVISALVASMFFMPHAVAGSPHFVAVSVARVGDSLRVSGKEAGLGNETQVHIVVTADAQCVNNGGKHPKAGNKESFGAGADFPVQNGQANFSLTLEAAFAPSCSPPMTVRWTNVVVSDAEHGVTTSFPGSF